jgi:hypothetical protein
MRVKLVNRKRNRRERPQVLSEQHPNADQPISCTHPGGYSRSDALLAEIMSGLVVYFNKALGNNLLYRFERGQYAKVRHEHGVDAGDEKPMSEIYGAEHLLRLFGKSEGGGSWLARSLYPAETRAS